MDTVEVPNQPHMDKEGAKAFNMLVRSSSNYLEYGCGGSTLLASAVGVKNIISVDTSRPWLDAVQTQLDHARAKVTLLHCDIGEVGDWGIPTTRERIGNFHSYATLPWRHAVKANISPDLVLVDGRFRVASFLFSLMSARLGTHIFFDDYQDRPGYHVVERYCELNKLAGRAGIFQVKRHYALADIAECFARYSIIPN